MLLVTGGCCHDYAKQKDILKEGIEERAQCQGGHHLHRGYPEGANGKPDATKPKLPIYGNPDYAKGYDVVIHDECAAGISDEKTVEARARAASRGHSRRESALRHALLSHRQSE